MLVLIVIETTDVIFAVDSIPAIFAITQDPFIVYTSNVFAILGLRALYFMLAGIMEMFIYLKIGLSFVLGFVGTKMLLTDLYKIPIGASLAIIGGVLLLSVIASLLVQQREATGTAPRPIRKEPRQEPIRNSTRVPAPTLTKIGLSLFSLASILTLVTWDTIARGPGGHEAITVLRVVERQLAQAKWEQSEIQLPSLGQANATLEKAWISLEDKRYRDAISLAQDAAQILESAIPLK